MLKILSKFAVLALIVFAAIILFNSFKQEIFKAPQAYAQISCPDPCTTPKLVNGYGYLCVAIVGCGSQQPTTTTAPTPQPTIYTGGGTGGTTGVYSGSSCSYGSYNQCDSLSGSGYQCTPYCYTAGCGGVGKCCPSGTTWDINTGQCVSPQAINPTAAPATPTPTPKSSLYSCTSSGACGGATYCCVKSSSDTIGVCQGSCTGTSYPYRKECAYQGQSPDPSQQIACCSGLTPQTTNSCTCPSGTSPTTNGGTCLQNQITICSSTPLSNYQNVCPTITTPTPTISQNDPLYCSWFPNLCPTATPKITSTPTPVCDPNHDGRLDISDFTWWKDEFSGTRTTKESDCFKPDGVVDLLDFQVWKNKFLQGTVDAPLPIQR